jgi:porin
MAVRRRVLLPGKVPSWIAGILLFAIAPSNRGQDAITNHCPVDTNAISSIRPSALADRGISFPVEIYAEVLGNFSGGTSHKLIWESEWDVGVAIDLEKAMGWYGASALTRVLYTQGSGLTNAAVHDFNTLSNIDAYDSLRLYDAWMEQEFADGQFSIRFGQLLADAEFFYSENGALFLNSSFGAIPLVSKNLNPPIFPVAAPGLRLRVNPSDRFYAEAAIFSGDVGIPETTNKHNTRFSFPGEDGVLIFAEIGYHTHPAPTTDSANSPKVDEARLAGSYKLGGYYDSKEFADVGAGAPHQGEYSIYFIAEQELWHPSGKPTRTLSAFTRIGFAPPDRSTVTFYGDAGFNFRGIIANRPKDNLGLAFSYACLSSDLRDEFGRPFRAHYEAICEFTYEAALSSHMSIQPDLQIIINPGSNEPASTAVVSGLRLNIAF